jgi:pentatricopeptide repeat protein
MAHLMVRGVSRNMRSSHLSFQSFSRLLDIGSIGRRSFGSKIDDSFLLLPDAERPTLGSIFIEQQHITLFEGNNNDKRKKVKKKRTKRMVVDHEESQDVRKMKGLLKSLGKKQSASTIENMIKRYSVDGQWEKAIEVFKFSEKHHMKKNISTFRAILSACAKGNQYERAIYFLQSMEKFKLEPDIECINSAIEACVNEKQWGKALELFNSIKLRGLIPTTESFQFTIAACEQAGRNMEAKLFSTTIWTME